MIKYEFGDRILYQGHPAVYLHVSDNYDDMHYISVKIPNRSSTHEMSARDDEIIHQHQVCDIPDDKLINVRDTMVFIYGQICAIQFYCDSNAGDALENIGSQFEKVLKELFKDYK